MDESLESFLVRALRARKVDAPKIIDLAGLIPPPLNPQCVALMNAFGWSGFEDCSFEGYEDFVLVLVTKPEDKVLFWSQLHVCLCHFFQVEVSDMTKNTSDQWLLKCDQETHGFDKIFFQLNGQVLHVLASVS